MKTLLLVLGCAAVSHAHAEPPLDILKSSHNGVTLQELAHLSAFKITFEGGSAAGGTMNPFSLLMSPFMMLGGAMSGGEGGGQSSGLTGLAMFDFLFSGVYWTNGSDVGGSESKFIVAYTVGLDWMKAMNSEGADALGPKELISVRPIFIKISSITSVSPMPEFSGENFMKLLEKMEEGAKSGGASAPTSHEVAAPDGQFEDAQQMCVSILTWCEDYDHAFPKANSSAQLIEMIAPYSRNPEVYKGFRYNVRLSGKSQTDVHDPYEMPMIWAAKPDASGNRIVGFCDGHVTKMDAQQWQLLVDKYLLKV